MSLLDEAKQHGSTSGKLCTLAKQVQEKLPEARWSEVGELLLSTDVTQAAKHQVLKNNKVEIADSTLRTKLREGCKCEWCKANWSSNT